MTVVVQAGASNAFHILEHVRGGFEKILRTETVSRWIQHTLKSTAVMWILSDLWCRQGQATLTIILEHVRGGFEKILKTETVSRWIQHTLKSTRKNRVK